jgi:hypothetical protein
VEGAERGGAFARLHTPADYLEAASDPDAGEGMLCHLAQCPYSFVWQALARNPRTPGYLLEELCSRRDSTWNDNRLLRLIVEHPNADRAVLLSALAELETRLREPLSRPYAAVLALADRPELAPDEVQRLAALPGASARMRRGLRRRLAQREPVSDND